MNQPNSHTTTSSPEIHVGLIGCGARMRSVMQPPPGIRVTAISDPHPDSVAAARAQYGDGLVVHRDFRALLDDEAISWIGIGSWNSRHAEHAVAALEAGKNVFCEKPLATNLADGLRVRDAVRAARGKFFFGLVLRYAPIYRKVKEILDSGALGRIVSFEFNETLGLSHGGYIMGGWRRFRENAGTHMLEKCCHDLDLANWLTGSLPARAASFGGLSFFTPEFHSRREAVVENLPDVWNGVDLEDPFLSKKDIVDNQVVILEYRNGVRATFHTNCNTGLSERRFYLCGTDATLRADALTGVVEWKGTLPSAEPHRWEAGIGGGHAGADEFMCAGLFDVMRSGGEPAAGIDEALNSAISAFGIDAALDSGSVFSLDSLWEKIGR